jgi:hypothetical protein
MAAGADNNNERNVTMTDTLPTKAKPQELQYKHLKSVDEVYDRTIDPHHKKILHNYRIHVALEQGLRWQEILVDEMGIPELEYCFRFNGVSSYFTGRDGVAELYSSQEPFSAVLVDEKLAVADWGIASWASHYAHGPGSQFIEAGVELDDPDALYLEISNLAMFWRYTPDALLIGEEVYQIDEPTYRKVTPEEYYSKEEIVADSLRYLAEHGV